MMWLQGLEQPTTIHASTSSSVWCQRVCGHEGYDNTSNLRNKRNRHNYGLVIWVHDKSTQRAQQAQLWLAADRHVYRACKKYATQRWRSDSTGAIRLMERAT
jgi:NADPH-dependent ferric siderophore reductase